MRRMAGKAHDTKNDFEQCAALRDWKLTHVGGLPSRSSDNDAEKALANWLSKALQRRQRALGCRPRMRQLTSDEAAHLDSIMGMTIGEISAQVPAPSHDSMEVTLRGMSTSTPANVPGS